MLKELFFLYWLVCAIIVIVVETYLMKGQGDRFITVAKKNAGYLLMCTLASFFFVPLVYLCGNTRNKS